MAQALDTLADQLYKNNIVKFGEFKLRSGEISPVYFDLRQIISYPNLLRDIAYQYITIIDRFITQQRYEDYPLRVCGVAYTGIPIATAISLSYGDMPMLMKRKEAKEYGTKQLIEGFFDSDDGVVLIDDVITSGGSLLETIVELEAAGLRVIGVFVLIDRRPIVDDAPNPDYLETEKGDKRYPLSYVYKMDNLLHRIRRMNPTVTFPANLGGGPRISFEKRSSLAQSKVSTQLMQIMASKQTNLVLSADVNTMEQLLHLAETVGPKICMLKTHVDMIEDFSYSELIPRLKELSRKHNFLILEDRKFADIGNTVIQQYTGGIHRIHAWADLVTVHALLGEGIVSTFNDIISGGTNCKKDDTPCGILLIAELSTKDNLINEDYTAQCCRLAEKYPNIVSGLICGKKLIKNEGFLHLTPGVNLADKYDNLDQVYTSPEHVIGTLKSDVIIVGRGIYQSENPVESAEQYRLAAWNSYLKDL